MICSLSKLSGRNLVRENALHCALSYSRYTAGSPQFAARRISPSVRHSLIALSVRPRRQLNTCRATPQWRSATPPTSCDTARLSSATREVQARDCVRLRATACDCVRFQGSVAVDHPREALAQPSPSTSGSSGEI